MRAWIIIAALAGGLYYLYTETDKLNEPIAETQAQLKKFEQKLDSLTGTQLIRVDGRLEKLKLEAAQRLSAKELDEFNTVLNDKYSLNDFKTEYCSNGINTHPIFSSDNLQFICKNL